MQLLETTIFFRQKNKFASTPLKQKPLTTGERGARKELKERGGRGRKNHPANKIGCQVK
jgi:hypothetical protein